MYTPIRSYCVSLLRCNHNKSQHFKFVIFFNQSIIFWKKIMETTLSTNNFFFRITEVKSFFFQNEIAVEKCNVKGNVNTFGFDTLGSRWKSFENFNWTACSTNVNPTIGARYSIHIRYIFLNVHSNEIWPSLRDGFPATRASETNY